jgi:hypothetical protein
MPELESTEETQINDSLLPEVLPVEAVPNIEAVPANPFVVISPNVRFMATRFLDVLSPNAIGITIDYVRDTR